MSVAHFLSLIFFPFGTQKSLGSIFISTVRGRCAGRRATARFGRVESDKGTGTYYACRSICATPLPIANFGQVLAIFVDEMPALDELTLLWILWRCRPPESRPERLCVCSTLHGSIPRYWLLADVGNHPVSFVPSA